MHSVIVARDVAYELANGRELFKNLSFALSPIRSALVGPNGVGKTSLARLIAGEIEPSRGSIQRHGAVKVFEQREQPERITVAEFLANDEHWSLTRERLLSNIDYEALCTELSGGQWTRVRLAHALDDGFLILDEPTNNLDREGREAVVDFLRSHTGGVLLISHDRECLELSEDILELSNVGLMKFGGNWSAYVEERSRERERLASALDQAKRERDAAVANRIELRERQEKRNRHASKVAARGGVPKIILGGRKRQAQVSSGKVDVSTLKRCEDSVLEAHTALSRVKVDPVMYADLLGHELPAQKLIAEASGFNVRLHDWVFANDLDFAWRGSARIALKGANGSGKSTLLRALTGAPFETRGTLKCGSLVTLYLDQHGSVLDENATVLDNIRAVSADSESGMRNDLARFLFAGDKVFQKVSELSGGERVRAAMARGLLGTKPPDLILLDEPTNNLDLANIEFLENVIAQFRGALIVISHDLRFLESCGVSQELTISGAR